MALIRCTVLNNHIHTNIQSPRHSPGQTVLAVSSVVQFVVNHCSHCQRPRITAQECHFTAIQDPHGPLHIVQCPLQVGGLMGHPVQLEVQQGNACIEDSTLGMSDRLNLTRGIGMSLQFYSAGNRPVQPV